MAKDSNYGGTAIGFNAKSYDLGLDPMLGDSRGLEIGFVTSRELNPEQPKGLLNSAFNKVKDFDYSGFLPRGKLLAGAALVGASIAAVANPQELGKFTGEISTGFKAATLNQQLCKEDCAIPRIAGEKIGGWTVQFEKGFNSRFTQ